MTTEEKYKQALERARIGLHDCNLLDCDDMTRRAAITTIYHLFPELAESDDERIRRGIIRNLQYLMDRSKGFVKDELSERIAWLEKQGESNSQTVLTLPKFTFNDVLALQCCMETVKKVQEDKELYEKLNDLHSKVYDSYQLEKQSEQPTDEIEQNPAWCEEDEEMLKWLCRIIHTQRLDRAITLKEESELGEWIDKWLNYNPQTKQCEQKPNPYSGTSFEYNGHIWGMCARDNGVEILFDGELKAFLSLEKSFIYPIYPKPDLAHKSAIEAIKDNVGNNNKVEPKFKVGY